MTSGIKLTHLTHKNTHTNCHPLSRSWSETFDSNGSPDQLTIIKWYCINWDTRGLDLLKHFCKNIYIICTIPAKVSLVQFGHRWPYLTGNCLFSLAFSPCHLRTHLTLHWFGHRVDGRATPHQLAPQTDGHMSNVSPAKQRWTSLNCTRAKDKFTSCPPCVHYLSMSWCTLTQYAIVSVTLLYPLVQLATPWLSQS